MKRIIKLMLPLALFAFSLLRGGFLVDENPEPAKVVPADSGTVAQSVGFPSETALNISVTPIEGIPNSVRITWDVSAGSSDTFIVGRSQSIADNPKTALEALSIRVVPSGANRAIVDRNIPAGSYYYVILSKKRSAGKSIDLYPNENYTTNPIIIGSASVAQKSAPPQVKGISAELVAENSVLVSWKPLDFVGVTYSVYRSMEQINSPDKVNSAEKIAELYDRDRYVDRSPASGVCYYAVVTSDSSGVEDTRLVANESYTVSGVNIIKTDAAKVVSSLKALPNDRGGVDVSWKGIPGFDGEYLVYRARNAIKSAAALEASELAGSVPSSSQEFTDKKSGYGEFYYAVVAKDSSGRKNTDLFDGYNFTRSSVYLAEPQDPVRLKIIKAEAQDGSAVVTWKYSGTMQRDFLLYRSESAPSAVSDVSDAYLVDTIDLTRNSFRDTNIPDGSYYYILVPENFIEDKNFFLRKGINFTSIPVDIRSAVADSLIRVRSISASAGDGAGETKIIWKYSGTEGSGRYSMLRFSSAPQTKQQAAEGVLAGVVDIASQSFVDKPSEDGSYYYALLPEDYMTLQDIAFVRGENLTSSPVIPAQKPAAGAEKPLADNVVKGSDSQKTKTDTVIPEPDAVVDRRKVETPETPSFSGSSDVDHILKKYFYTKKYDAAIKNFRALASSSSDEKTIAQALFYAGRAYVEKGDYRTALNYFLNKKVRNALSRQSDFWKDYCIKRMENK